MSGSPRGKVPRLRNSAAAGLVAVAAMSAAACRPSQPAQAGAPSSTTVVASCDGVRATGARCVSLSVAENRAAPGRHIPLRVVVLPATRALRSPDPVVYLSGGPGQAASSIASDGLPLVGALRTHRDLVFADQRGTGGSGALLCDFYGPPDRPHRYFTEFLPLDRVRACRDKLQRDADLRQYTTPASVEDLEAIRVALGYPQINLVGGSYGTRLAMEYVRRYEKHVRAVVLDSPVTSATHSPESFGRHASAALDALIDECAAASSCAAAFPGLRAEAAAVFDRVRQKPVTATVAHPSAGVVERVTLTRNHVAEAVRYLMYSSRGASTVPFVLHRAFDGDYAPIAQFLIRWRASGTFDGLYLSITCAEDVPFVATDAGERDESTYLGSYRVREQRAACAEWPHAEPAPRPLSPVTAAVPVLIISGTHDPVTPPANGDEIARTLRHSVHVRVPSGGHSPNGLAGLDCLDDLVRATIERGDVEGLDTSCVARIRRPGFKLAE
jgi:pimeloyl-ACP methyl ester carboxylesterase